MPQTQQMLKGSNFNVQGLNWQQGKRSCQNVSLFCVSENLNSSWWETSMFGPCTDALEFHLMCCGPVRRLWLKEMSWEADPEQLAHGELCTALLLAPEVIFGVHQ